MCQEESFHGMFDVVKESQNLRIRKPGKLAHLTKIDHSLKTIRSGQATEVINGFLKKIFLHYAHGDFAFQGVVRANCTFCVTIGMNIYSQLFRVCGAS